MAPLLHAQGNSLSANQVTIVQHSPARYLIQYKTDRPGIVFVSETAYPGWKVQDHRFRVITVFGSFIGVVIPFAGDGEIDLQFSSTAVRRGAFISSAGVLAVLLFAFAARLRRPQSLTVKTELAEQTHNSRA